MCILMRRWNVDLRLCLSAGATEVFVSGGLSVSGSPLVECGMLSAEEAKQIDVPLAVTSIKGNNELSPRSTYLHLDPDNT